MSLICKASQKHFTYLFFEAINTNFAFSCPLSKPSVSLISFKSESSCWWLCKLSDEASPFPMPSLLRGVWLEDILLLETLKVRRLFLRICIWFIHPESPTASWPCWLNTIPSFVPARAIISNVFNHVPELWGGQKNSRSKCRRRKVLRWRTVQKAQCHMLSRQTMSWERSPYSGNIIHFSCKPRAQFLFQLRLG